MRDADPLHLRFLDFELDERNALLTRGGRPVALAPKAFAVLCVLARQAGQLVSKEDLLDAAWGHRHVSESVLKTTISELRAALQDDAREPCCIGTAARRGYRFLAEAMPPGGPDAPAAVPNQAAWIGRAEALDRLQSAWAEACEGRARIVWVAGEAGIGKTSVIDAFSSRLGARALQARGQCVEQFGAAEPYLPVLEALGTMCREDPSLPATMRAVAPAWLLQLPWLTSLQEREALQRELAGTSPDRMLRELAELLDRCTGQRPLLLVTEDLHWSDPSTVRLLDHLARRRSAMRLLWLGSFRVAELVGTEHPLKGVRHTLRMQRLADEILLDPFSEKEVADYLQRRLPRAALSDAFVRKVHTRTEGLPLFLVNVVDDLAAREAGGAAAVPADDAAWQVPEHVAGLIEAQLGRLPADALGMLEVASVCGVEFRPGVVAELLEQDVHAVAQRCDTLARQQVWLRAGEPGPLADGTLDVRYVFRHALYRQVFYQRLGALARARLHQRIGAALARGRAAGMAVAAAELASHFELGQDPMAALRHQVEAVDTVLGRYAPAEAIALTGQALALVPRCPPGPARLQLELALLLKRGVACSQLLGMSSPEAKAAHERAQEICDQLPATPALGWVLGGLGLARYGQGEYEAAHALGERVGALASQHADAGLRISASNLLGMSCWARGEIEAGRRWLAEGLAAADTLGGRMPQGRFFVDPVVAMRGHMALTLIALGRADAARAEARLGLARGRASGHPMAEALSTRCAGLLEIALHEPERVAERARAMRAIGARHGIVQAEGTGRLLGGWAQAQQGEPEAGHAEILAGQAILMRIGMVAGCVQYFGYATEALILARRWADAQVQLDEAWQLAQRLGERARRPELLCLRARIAAEQGDPAGARALLHEALHEAEAQGALWIMVSALVALCESGGVAPADLAALRTASARIEGEGTALQARAAALLQAPA